MFTDIQTSRVINIVTRILVKSVCVEILIVSVYYKLVSFFFTIDNVVYDST